MAETKSRQRIRRTTAWATGLGVLVGAVVLANQWYGPLAAAALSRPIAFTKVVSRSQYALIDFQSSGCFHFTHYRLRYEPTPAPRLLVTDCNPHSDDANSGRSANDRTSKDLGAVLLTHAQVARLDNLLRFYRKYNQKGCCTTSDSISIVLYQNGHPVRQEQFVDFTCESELLADADPRDLTALKRADAPILSLRSVIAQAAQARKQGLAAVRYHTALREQTNAYRAVRERREAAREAVSAQQMVKELAGYRALCREFHVREIMLGDMYPLPYSLFTTLAAIRPRVVDAAWWSDPVVKDRPQYDWNQFLAIHREVERVVARHTWIAAWKKAGPGRTAEAHIFGITPTEETELATMVTPGWKHAGLKGAPRYQLVLRRSVNTWAELYFGKEDPRALIVMASPARDDELMDHKHWLDSLGLVYHPTEEIPDYVIVNPDGTWQRNSRPKEDRSPPRQAGDRTGAGAV